LSDRFFRFDELPPDDELLSSAPGAVDVAVVVDDDDEDDVVVVAAAAAAGPAVVGVDGADAFSAAAAPCELGLGDVAADVVAAGAVAAGAVSGTVVTAAVGSIEPPLVERGEIVAAVQPGLNEAVVGAASVASSITCTSRDKKRPTLPL
jgi:hypothetical protein